MKRLLITGASGFLGNHLAKVEQEEWELYGTFLSNSNGIAVNVNGFLLDLTNENEVIHSIQRLKPHAVIHAAANSSTNECERYPEKTFPINVTASVNLAKACKNAKIPFLFISSAQVFDGEKGYYDEDDTPNPKNKYGEQKFDAEQRILSVYPQATIIRIPVLFGIPSAGNRSFMFDWLQTFEKKEIVTAFRDEIRSFLGAESAAKGIFKVLNAGEKGIFHLGGGQATDRYTFGKLLIKSFGISERLLVSKLREEVTTTAFRPYNLSLNSKKIEALGYEPKMILEELIHLKKNITQTINKLSNG